MLLKEEEFKFYKMEELGNDLRKLDKWKTKLIEKIPLFRQRPMKGLSKSWTKCRKLIRIFEKKCMEKIGV